MFAISSGGVPSLQRFCWHQRPRTLCLIDEQSEERHQVCQLVQATMVILRLGISIFERCNCKGLTWSKS